MDLAELLESCTTALTDADVRKICRHRGFSAEEARSGTLLRHLLLSDVGLPPLMASLSPPQVAVLHRLHLAPRPVDVAFFEPAFRAPEDCSPWAETFNQRHQAIFREVQEAFVRRGLVAVAKGSSCNDTTALSRLRFGLPPQFVPFLPPVGEPRTLEGVAIESAPDCRRARLLDYLGSLGDGTPASEDMGRPTILEGRLCLGNSPFTARALEAWRGDQWSRGLGMEGEASSPVPLVAHLFRHAQPGAWIAAEDLEGAVRQHFHADLIVHAHPRTWSAVNPTRAHLPTAEAICQAGWSVGFLEKCSAQGRTWYRLAAPACSPGSKTSLEESLSTRSEDSIQVELEAIPFETLEALAAFSRFAVEGRHLVARPDPVVIGRIQEGGAPLLTWLGSHSVAYRDVCQRMAGLAGRQVVHERLLVARIRDKVERMRLEQALSQAGNPSPLVSLGGEYVAFPRSLLGEVEKIARRAGLAVRKVVP